MSKHSLELKLDVVECVLKKRYSTWEAAREHRVDQSCVRKWVNAYEYHGIEGLTRKHGTYSGQFKIDVIEYMHTNHLSIRQIAAKFGIPSPKSVRDWEHTYYEKGPQALLGERRGRKKMTDENKFPKYKPNKNIEEDLIAENQRLKMENAYLKKLNALVQERIQRENGKK